MQELSRRTLLIATTTLATIPAGRAAAVTGAARVKAGAATRTPAAVGALHGAVAGQLGPLRVVAGQAAGTDALGLQITITNTGSVDETVTAWFTDTVTNKSSRTRRVTIPAGRFRSHTFFGHLDHVFMLNICLADGTTCLQLGPIGHAPGTPAPARRTQGLSFPPVEPNPANRSVPAPARKPAKSSPKR